MASFRGRRNVNDDQIQSTNEDDNLSSGDTSKFRDQNSKSWSFSMIPSSMRDLETIIGLDLFSLGFFRFCFGFVLLFDLYDRFQNLRDHYADLGVLPARAAITTVPTAAWSLLLMNSTVSFLYIAFSIIFCVYVCFFVGFKTRWTSILSFVCLVSLQNRNVLLHEGTDDLIRMILFWTMFLPVGKRFSIDRVLKNKLKLAVGLPIRNATKTAIFVSSASIALYIQVSFVFILSAAGKLQSDMGGWKGGAGFYYLLSEQTHSTSFGQYLANHLSTLLFILGNLYLLFEPIIPILLFFPVGNVYCKLFAVSYLSVLHFAWGLMWSHNSLFGISVVCVSLLFIPQAFWRFLFKKFEIFKSIKPMLYYDQTSEYAVTMVSIYESFVNPFISVYPAIPKGHPDCWFVAAISLPNATKSDGVSQLLSLSPFTYLISFHSFVLVIFNFFANNVLFEGLICTMFPVGNKYRRVKWPWSDFLKRIKRLVFEIVSILFLLFIFYWNSTDFSHLSMGGAKVDSQTVETAYMLGIQQNWKYLSPVPHAEWGWIVTDGVLSDHSQMDVFHNANLTYEMPTEFPWLHQRRWRNFYDNMIKFENGDLRLHWGRYICREWNWWGRHTYLVTNYKIYYVTVETQLDGSINQKDKIAIWGHEC